jgi:hypothetical protein
VKDGTDDLPASRRIRAPVPTALEHDRRPVIGLDDRANVGPKRPSRTLPERRVRATKAAADDPVAAALGKVQML